MRQNTARFLALLLSVFLVSPTVGDEILTNGSFEDGLNGWNDPSTASGNSIVGAPGVGAQGGTAKAVEITLAAGVGELRQSFPANPGDEFYLGGYVLTENAIPAGPSFGLYKIVFRDSGGNDLPPASVSQGNENIDFPGIDSAPIVDENSTPNNWVLSEAQGVAPAGTVEVIFLVLNVDFAGGVNPIWFDEIEAYNTADNVNLLTNGDFETCDLTGWTDPASNPGNAAVGAPTPTGAQDGSNAAELTLEAGVSELRQSAPAAPGDEFYFSGHMLTENVLPAGDSFGLLKIVFRDSDGNDLVPDSATLGQINTDFPGIESLPFLDSTRQEDTWVFSEAQGVAPAGTVEVLFIILNVDFAGGTNPIWFDNISACEVVQVATVEPESVTATRGTFVAGDVAELAASDNQDYQLRRSSSDIQSRTEFVVKGISPISNPSSFEFTLEGSVFARSNVVQTIELFDYDAASWELVDTRNSNRSPSPDSTVVVAGTGDLSRFVDDATGCIEARVQYKSDSPRQNFGSNTDQTIWVIEQ